MKIQLKCCGKTNPIGIDKEHLRLSFEADGDIRIISHEIQIASSEEGLTEGRYDVGVFKEENTSTYGMWLDPAYFKERTRYYWQVVAVTENGECRSEPGYFETGIGNWSAEWISAKKNSQNIQNFRKEFKVSDKVEEARLYICGLGYFTAFLNGKKLDDTYYKPLVTNYTTRNHPDNHYLQNGSSSRVTYYTYNITPHLNRGQNVLSVDVANGYFCNRERLPFEPDYSFGTPKLIFEIHLAGEREKQVIKSDAGTVVREQNYASGLYTGDFIDFTKEGNEYEPSVITEAPDGRPMAPQCEDDRLQEILSPVSECRIPEGILYDFGKNHTGGLEFLAESSEEGAELVIRYAEVMKEDGHPNYETSAWHDRIPHTGQTADIYQENRYILKKGNNRIEPLFNWYCYRYVVVEKPETVRIRGMTSRFICADVERNGHFVCSEECLNRINEMFLQTLRCNMHSGLITDCPHREKRPYTGDGQIVMKAAWYNMDMTTFYYKWFGDLLDAQTGDGLIPNSAPDLGGGGGYAWGNAICFVSKYLYQFTGDEKVARQGYRAIKKWLAYYQTKRDEDYVIRSNHHEWMLGDWLAPTIVLSNVYYISTVCYLIAVDTALFFAEKFAQAEIEKWKKLRANIAAGIQKHFFDEQSLSYGNGVQGEDVLALSVGIVPEQYEQAMKDKVERHYREETDYHLDTGIVLTPILIEYLTEHGYTEIAYRIMTARTYPSYFNLMENDTTFPEHWSKKWPDYYIGGEDNKLVKGGGELSHCHPMYGSVCSWLYERVAGLDLTELYRKKVVIKPYFIDCMEWAKANKITPYGKISVEWDHTKEGIKLGVIVPKGLTGEVSFPSHYYTMQNLCTGETYTATPGGYFRFRLPAGEWVLQTKGREEESSMTVKEYVEKNLPLSIRTNKEDAGALIGLPYPYIIPSVADMFQEMYYWDSYFANAGLIIRGDIEQAKNNVDDLRYLLDRYGFVLNGNNKGFEYNSQPPFLGKMIREVYDVTGDKEWLKECYTSLKKENAFWMEKRNTGFGLNHYDCEPLTEQMVKNGVRDLVGRIGYKPDCTAEEIARGNFSTGESGWDFNPRMRHETYKYAPADLNSLLYIQEDELEYFAGELGLVEEQQIWKERKEKRAELCRQYLKGEDGVFYDYHLEKKELNGIVSAASFYPLYAGMATKEEAEAAMKVLPRIEMTYGVAACEKCDDIPGNFQWGYPNGWPPMQRIMVEGMLKYGYEEDAKRIAEKYIALVDRCLETTGNMWEKYNVVEGNVEVVDEYKMPAMLGWTFGVYYRFCRLLGKEL